MSPGLEIVLSLVLSVVLTVIVIIALELIFGVMPIWLAAIIGGAIGLIVTTIIVSD
jgi:hypothetical protein